eukprot:TRINITY_DN7439_c0_g1_i1.p1 TRINITY_DN7439_c0_g1~~TRINITY_DN7439_c0_g1_i1.p1  ORF type:complete len:345 (-),score=47.20 TRINITY_DN7439_c0_g1_i1:43-1077(-)
MLKVFSKQTTPTFVNRIASTPISNPCCGYLTKVHSRRLHYARDNMPRDWGPFESKYETKLDPGKPVIIRIDGVSFSKLVPFLNLVRPFDQRLSLSMADAARDLLVFLKNYGASFAYVRSDEIDVLISEPKTPILGDDVQNISSICASVCSKSFNSSLTRRLYHPTDQDLKDASMKVFQIQNSRSKLDDSEFKLTSPKAPPPVQAYFDCRTFTVDSNIDDFVNILSTIQRKAIGNCTYTVAYFEGLGSGLSSEVSRQNLVGKNMKKQNDHILEEYGLDMSLYPPPFRKGFCVYKLSCKIATTEQQQQDGCVRFMSEQDQDGWVCDFNVPVFSSQPQFLRNILANK